MQPLLIFISFGKQYKFVIALASYFIRSYFKIETNIMLGFEGQYGRVKVYLFSFFVHVKGDLVLFEIDKFYYF